MRPNVETPRSRRGRNTVPPTETAKEHHETEVASIEAGLKLLEVYSSALKELKERGQKAAEDIKLALDLRHAPRDWSNTEILSVMSDVIDEHPRPKLEFVLGVLGLSKVPETLDERLRSQGAKAYAIGVRTRALRRKKEAREKEERERREKKEREEREKREKKEREERERRERQEKKEKEEKERKDRLERERAEKEKRKAAERKEAEAKRGRGKGRRGRRGRPSTRVAATERAKIIDADQEASAAQVLLEVSQGKTRNAEMMEVDTDGPKQNMDVRNMLKKDAKTEALQKDASSESAAASAGQVSSEERDAHPAPLMTVSLPPRHSNALTKSANGTESEDQQVSEASKGERSLSTDGNKAQSKTTLLAKEEMDPIGVVKASEVVQLSESVEKAGDNGDGLVTRSGVTSKEQERSTVLTTKKQVDEAAMGTGRQPEAGRHGAEEMQAPAQVAEAPCEEDAQVSKERSVAIAPKVIAEAKIASALKESAAALMGEISEVDLNPPLSTNEVTDVDGGSCPAQVMEVAVGQQAKDEKGTVKLDGDLAVARDNDVMMSENATAHPKAVKELTQPNAATQIHNEVSLEAKTMDEKGKITRSPEQRTEEPKEQEVATEAAIVESSGEGAEDVKEGDKEVIKPRDVSKEVSDAPKDKDGEPMPAKENEANDAEKAKEPELVAEDFLADVFGPEDGDGERDEAEEASMEQRGHRYRFRGRQSDHEKEKKAETVTTDKNLKVTNSDEESQAKEKRKRGRPKSGARRMSRRVSNIRDEIVVAPAGRRMRRESRNLIGAWQIPVPDQYLLECVEVWERLHGNRITIPFREPVAAKDAPGYFDIVTNPMDMRTVKDMLQNGQISTPDEFYKQMKLICSNALLFNDEASDLYELALELRGMIRKDTRPIVKSWREANGLDSEESESESEDENPRRRTKGRPRKKSSKAKSKTKGKPVAGKRKRGREDDDGGRNKKRRMLRRSARREEDN